MEDQQFDDSRPKISTTLSYSSTDLTQQAGRYRLIRLLGEGGFGRVWLAVDQELRRQVAIKIPQPERFRQPQDAEAYLTEARTVASLDHPNIVPVHDVGRTADGSVYVVSKYIEGATLADRIKQNRPGFEESAALVATIAEALDYAHQRRLIHRDVKPANILLEEASNRAYLADFGLAIREEDVVVGGRNAGTPAYMSPEQARGEGHRLDGRSDIFSLGAVLYEMLTGRRAFGGSTIQEELYHVLTVNPRPPRELDQTIPEELERICRKAISKRASDRYATAAEMALELREWRQQRKVEGGGRLIVPKGLRSFDASDADYFLELLPGPRDREGLPESIRFWKTRIEETEAEKTFAVGLLYGPSGCGKSSLVKAGLLPRLSADVVAVYVEATAEETELRLLRVLRKRLPELQEGLGLVETLALIRRGEGKKVVLVLDQFEQWLHAHREDADTELIRGLRQCDGANLQAVVMVRDDFAMAAARFMKGLEVPIVEGENFATVDLFDVEHAKGVLRRFGEAYGRISRRDAETQRREGKEGRGREEEGSEFVSAAVEGLAQDGKVVSVRLALFSEMVKGKSWTPETLEEVGGTEGVGVNFLEETFRSRSANPKYRMHEAAACGVLRALLPEVGTDIKGHMRSQEELLEASGYAGRVNEFEDLLRVLDGELRLITPTDPKGAGTGSGSGGSDAGEKFYQLTHDYVVPSLREWLTRRQRESRKGRAEIRLAERAALWKAKPENRHLPSLWEYLSIRRWTRRKDWKADERRMMAKAGRAQLARTSIVAGLVAAVVAGGIFARNRIEEGKRQQEAAGLVAQLASADVGQVPGIVRRIGEYRQYADPLLRAAHAKAEVGSAERLHTALALLALDTSMVGELRDALLLVTPGQFPVVRDALLSHKSELVEPLWSVALDEKRAIGERFQAACGLATYAAEDERWTQESGLAAGHLVSLQASEYLAWREALLPARGQLIPSLAAIYRDGKQKEQGRIYATETLAEYAGDKAEVLFELLADSEQFQFPVIFEKSARHRERTIELAREELRKSLTQSRKDAKEEKEEKEKRREDKGWSEEEKEKLAKRQANAAVALAKLGASESMWPVLRHSPDPRVRSYVIHWLAALGADPKAILERLENEPDVTIRRALVLALGEFSEGQLSKGEREKLVEKLIAMFENEPDAGLHGSCEWLLKQWGQQAKIDDVVKKLQKNEAQLQAAKGNEKRQWYVNSQGQTMVVLDAGEFQMGSPENEPDRNNDEVLHKEKIGRRFAMAAHETTKGEYQRFLKAVKTIGANNARWVKTLDSPETGVTWYEAAWYCNWLSEVEGIAKEQWCYEANEKGVFGPGMKAKKNHVSLVGYRLPTEAEWEYACRSGSATSRYYGLTESLLPRYAWYLANGSYRTWPAASLKPNDFGLFDMQGNALEWCFDAYKSYSSNLLTKLGDVFGGTAEIVEDVEIRAVRGGSVLLQPVYVRSADRYISYRPSERYNTTGFRMARTYN